ncbi:hypothetical protein F5882DRAFT_419274 [Hyaloscypha sp. PMI_1271]|nr:hypothetical protein F5882DRAFT_419274 [Hyaloscypha sp. PMI_1271]
MDIRLSILVSPLPRVLLSPSPKPAEAPPYPTELRHRPSREYSIYNHPPSQLISSYPASLHNTGIRPGQAIIYLRETMITLLQPYNIYNLNASFKREQIHDLSTNNALIQYLKDKGIYFKINIIFNIPLLHIITTSRAKGTHAYIERYLRGKESRGDLYSLWLYIKAVSISLPLRPYIGSFTRAMGLPYTHIYNIKRATRGLIPSDFHEHYRQRIGYTRTLITSQIPIIMVLITALIPASIPLTAIYAPTISHTELRPQPLRQLLLDRPEILKEHSNEEIIEEFNTLQDKFNTNNTKRYIL